MKSIVMGNWEMGTRIETETETETPKIWSFKELVPVTKGNEKGKKWSFWESPITMAKKAKASKLDGF